MSTSKSLDIISPHSITIAKICKYLTFYRYLPSYWRGILPRKVTNSHCAIIFFLEILTVEMIESTERNRITH